jgi:hypothetical protein
MKVKELFVSRIYRLAAFLANPDPVNDNWVRYSLYSSYLDLVGIVGHSEAHQVLCKAQERAEKVVVFPSSSFSD